MSMKVKPLVWSHRNDQPAYEVCADCPFGRYAISPAGEYGYGWKQPRQSVWSGYLPTCDEAKAAAQQDYEARILSALAPQAGDNADADGTALLIARNALNNEARRAGPLTVGEIDDVFARLSRTVFSHPCTSTPVLSQNAPDLEDKGGDEELVFADRHNDEMGECEMVEADPAMVSALRKKVAEAKAARLSAPRTPAENRLLQELKAERGTYVMMAERYTARALDRIIKAFEASTTPEVSS